MRRHLEQGGIDLAELTAGLLTRLNRISEAVDTGGLEIHLRTDEMDALRARVERLGNRVAESALAAALIEASSRATRRSARGRGRAGGGGPRNAKLGAFIRPSRRRR